jgi:hypothetical protein
MISPGQARHWLGYEERPRLICLSSTLLPSLQVSQLQALEHPSESNRLNHQATSVNPSTLIRIIIFLFYRIYILFYRISAHAASRRLIECLKTVGHLDPLLPVILRTDASYKAIGPVISQNKHESSLLRLSIQKVSELTNVDQSLLWKCFKVLCQTPAVSGDPTTFEGSVNSYCQNLESFLLS